MGREQQDHASEEEQAERDAQENREKLDAVPPPGTDPLHEGP